MFLPTLGAKHATEKQWANPALVARCVSKGSVPVASDAGFKDSARLGVGKRGMLPRLGPAGASPHDAVPVAVTVAVNCTNPAPIR